MRKPRKPKYTIMEDGIVIQPNSSKSKSNEHASLVKCPVCKKCRTVKNSYIFNQKSKNKWTGCCLSCLAKKRNAGWAESYHPSYKGHKKITSDGYVSVSMKSLRGTSDYELAEPMSYKNGNIKRILEHRLVMARKLVRPLNIGEIVHHKNGVKTDNTISNLELLTTTSHHKGHGDYYYQMWQKTLSELNELKNATV